MGALFSASAMRRADGRERVRGFSTKTCLPAARAATVRGVWLSSDVRTKTTWTDGLSITAWGVRVLCGMRNLAAQWSMCVWETSQMDSREKRWESRRRTGPWQTWKTSLGVLVGVGVLVLR